MSQFIDNIRKRVKSGEYRFTIHAFERCIERNISPSYDPTSNPEEWDKEFKRRRIKK